MFKSLTRRKGRRSKSSDPCKKRSTVKHNDSGIELDDAGRDLSEIIDIDPGHTGARNWDKTLETLESVEVNYYDPVHYNNQPQLNLKPLYFEVPQTSALEFHGREWLYSEIVNSGDHVLVTGGPGSGKTALILNIVEKSCFGGRRLRWRPKPELASDHLGRHVVSYHFCQSDVADTCHVASFIHSVSAQLSQCPQLTSYLHLLHEDPDLLHHLSPEQCQADPDQALHLGILQPLSSTTPASSSCLWILVDGLCEAEHHRPDHGHTLASFINKHLQHFPPWLKIIITKRTGVNINMDHRVKIIRYLSFIASFTKYLFLYCSFENIFFSLDPEQSVDVSCDISLYINSRCLSSSRIQSNIQIKDTDTCLTSLTSHLVNRAAGCFLYVKLLLEFIEKGHIVIKSLSFKLLPQTLSEMYQLAFNLIFLTSQSYEPVHNIFSVCLASLRPLTLETVHQVLGSVRLEESEVGWSQYLAQYNSVSQLLVMRADKTLMFLHPTLRDWLVTRRRDGQHKFSVSPRYGHTALCLHMVRSQPSISGHKILELAHHCLKANIHKNSVTCSSSEVVMSTRDLQSLFLSLSAADINSALVSAENIFRPSVRINNLLLMSGADPNMLTDHCAGASLLSVWSYLGYADMVSLLLEWGADISSAEGQPVSAVQLAAAAGHSEVVMILVRAGAELSDDLVRRAAAAGHTDTVLQLLDRINTSDQSAAGSAWSTAMTAAAENSQCQLVETLMTLEHADLARVDTDTGLTPVSAAVRSGDCDMVNMILQHCTHCSHTRLQTLWRDSLQKCHDYLGGCPDSGHQCDDSLQSHTDSCLLLTPGLMTPLHLAINTGHLSVVETLLEHGADVDSVDEEGRTGLMLALEWGDREMVNMLIQRGAVVSHDKHVINSDVVTESGEHSDIDNNINKGGVNDIVKCALNTVSCNFESKTNCHSI